jgi:cysteine desulfurase
VRGSPGAAAAVTPPVYLDHAATTPMRPEVAEAMAPFSAERFGNASGSHQVARAARRALDDARELVADLLGADAGGVIFTSSGTESANLAITGTLIARARDGRPPGARVCSAVEHAAVLETCRAAARPGAGVAGCEPVDLRVVPVDPDGRLDLAALQATLGADVAVVSVMLANNEVGTVQPLDAVGELVRRHAPGAVLHTDAVQGACFLDLAEQTRDADLVSISAHKLGGPQGTGALVLRGGAEVAPLIHGGGQERGRRSGTHDVAGAVGLARALELAGGARKAEVDRVGALRDRLADAVVAGTEGATESVPERALVLPGHCHLRFAGVEQEELLMLLDREGVCASAGAACASGALEPSHVLAAMGVTPADARSAVRFTLGYTTTAADVERAATVVARAVTRLRG